MNIQIKNLFTQAILHESDYASILEAVNEAVRLKRNLQGANLQGANLRGANLRGANLQDVDLQDADLQHADLRGANLQYANLRRANLRCADLRCADLQHANLQGADLQGADLQHADLRDAKNSELIIAQTRILPSEGSIIGWKKCKNKVIVKLKIEENTRRSNAFGRKCRADFVTVLEVYNGDFGISSHNGQTVYKKGEIVKCDNWNPDFTQECAGGIHFFITRIEAENYIL